MWTRSLLFRSPDVTQERLQAIVETSKQSRRKTITYKNNAEPFESHFAHINPFVANRWGYMDTFHVVLSHWECGIRARAYRQFLEQWFKWTKGGLDGPTIKFSRARYARAMTPLPSDGQPYTEKFVSVGPSVANGTWDGNVILTYALYFDHWDNEGTSDWTLQSARAQLAQEIAELELLSYCGITITADTDIRIVGITARTGSAEAKYSVPSMYQGKPLNNSYASYIVRATLDPCVALGMLTHDLPCLGSSAVASSWSTHATMDTLPAYAAIANDIFTDWRIGGVMHVPQEDLDRYIWSDRSAYQGEAWFPLMRWGTPVGKSPIADTGFQLTLHRQGNRRWVQASTEGIDEDLQRAEIQRVTGIQEGNP